MDYFSQIEYIEILEDNFESLSGKVNRFLKNNINFLTGLNEPEIMLNLNNILKSTE